MRLSKFCILILFLSLTTGLSAQKRIAREFHLGVLGGGVMSTYNFQPKVTQDMATGYTFGVAARYIEETIFGLQAEFTLTRRGMKDLYDKELYPNLSFQRDLTYIEMPVLAHIYFKLGQKNEIAVDLGPKVGYFLSDKKTENLPEDEWEELLWTVIHNFEHHDMPVSKRWDYGIQAGIGYEFKLNKDISIQLQGRYYFGLGNMFPDKKSDVFEVSNNQQIQIVAAVWWHQQIAKYLIKKKQKKYRR